MHNKRQLVCHPNDKTHDDLKNENELYAIIETKMRKLNISKKVKIQKKYTAPDMAMMRLKMRKIMEEEKQKKLSRRAIFLDNI